MNTLTKRIKEAELLEKNASLIENDKETIDKKQVVESIKKLISDNLDSSINYYLESKPEMIGKIADMVYETYLNEKQEEYLKNRLVSMVENIKESNEDKELLADIYINKISNKEGLYQRYVISEKLSFEDKENSDYYKMLSKKYLNKYSKM